MPMVMRAGNLGPRAICRVAAFLRLQNAGTVVSPSVLNNRYETNHAHIDRPLQDRSAL